MPATLKAPLAGTRVAITRPVGTGTTLARRVRALGGTPLLLPGSRLQAPDDLKAARTALREALTTDAVIFTSPASVRFGARLSRLRATGRVFAPGRGTANALRRAGVRDVLHPEREDSEGLLTLPALRNVRGQRIGIVGAAGGRGLLQRELAARGAKVLQANVYQRSPARLDRRHAQALLHAPQQPLYVLLTSAQALANIPHALPADARRALLAGTAVVSSERLAHAARSAGFRRVLRATSVHATAMLTAVISDKHLPASMPA